jgi:hypothetical protein
VPHPWLTSLILLFTYPEVELLDHMVILFNFLGVVSIGA